MRKIIQRCTLYMSYVGMVLLLPMMLLTSSEVIGRAVWSQPIPGSMELSSYMLAAFILLGLAYTQQVKGHVRVTMFVSRLPKAWALILDVITALLSLFIIAVMAWQGWVVGIKEQTVSDMLRIPQFPFRLLVSVGGVFLFLELFLELTDTLKRLVRR
ncbi:MAG: TRAP transporter small permease [Deltaproteobacteria bacterium]|nr:TRAP transporter small permease [Deltaproteobacteria bacterium]